MECVKPNLAPNSLSQKYMFNIHMQYDTKYISTINRICKNEMS